MPQPHPVVLDDIHRPGVAGRSSTPLPRRVPTVRHEPLSSATVLSLLFDLAQLVARFGVVPDPWSQLAAYDTEAFAAFTSAGGEEM
ncbi:hypothetical protein AB0D34_07910 [Streptomyces sp. NPDC048420]|uniref:hypothetical protein n=1 Tax=Streptomyces sp. NPDC048420 TaxID=3155755 RepID=UPI003419BFEE